MDLRLRAQSLHPVRHVRARPADPRHLGRLRSQALSWRRLRLIAGALFASYAALALAAYFGQSALIYPAPRRADTPRLEGATLERIPARGGAVFALHAAAPPGAVTLVHFHGNGEELADLEPLLASYRSLGLGVYAVEYPGYGLSRDARPSEPALYAAAESALTHLRGRLGVPPSTTLLVGQSLGAAVAVEMARRGHGTHGLVLLSPFTSLPDVAAVAFPFLPSRYMVHDRYESLAKAGALALPALVIHGDRDEIVPFEMGRSLAERLPRGRLLAIEGGRHNDLFAVSGARVLGAIGRFAREPATFDGR